MLPRPPGKYQPSTEFTFVMILPRFEGLKDATRFCRPFRPKPEPRRARLSVQATGERVTPRSMLPEFGQIEV